VRRLPVLVSFRRSTGRSGAAVQTAPSRLVLGPCEVAVVQASKAHLFDSGARRRCVTRRHFRRQSGHDHSAFRSRVRRAQRWHCARSGSENANTQCLPSLPIGHAQGQVARSRIQTDLSQVTLRSVDLEGRSSVPTCDRAEATLKAPGRSRSQTFGFSELLVALIRARRNQAGESTSKWNCTSTNSSGLGR